MAPPDDSQPGDRQSDISSRPQDPRVDDIRPTPTSPPRAGLTLTGFLADSARSGYARLYLDTRMSSYVEFEADVVENHRTIPAESAPFLGDKSTEVTLRPGARFEYTRSQSLTTDDFILDPLYPGSPPLGGELDITLPYIRCRYPYTRP